MEDMITKWEYTMAYGSKLEELCELGKQGWEAVGITADNGNSNCLLKRPAGKLKVIEHRAATIQ